MSNWLIELSERPRTEEELLQESIDRFSVSDLKKLAFDLDPLSLPTGIDDMKIKIGHAIQQGQELAREQPELEKIAFLPALAAGAARLAPLAGRVLGGGGAKAISGGIAKDMAISAAGNKIMGALKPAAPAAAAAGQVAGGFKYATISSMLSSAAGKSGGILQRAAGYVAKNPGTALTAAGAVGGAVMAPRDPETGQKQYLKGALVGGGLAAGANAISNGRLANRFRSSVMNRESPLMGQGVRNYMMDAAAATKGKAPLQSVGSRSGQARYSRAATLAPSSTPALAPVASSTPVAQAAPTSSTYVGGPTMRGPVSAAPHTGGPVMGAVKLAFASMSPAEQILFVAQQDALEKKANRQTLTYDPATKTFMRHHLNADVGTKDLTRMGAKPIPAGSTEPVKNSITHAGPNLAPFGSQEYMNTRLERVRAKNGINPDVGVPIGTKVAPLRQASIGRASPPPIPTRVPGAIAGVAGIGAVAAKPVSSGVGAVLGKAMARR